MKIIIGDVIKSFENKEIDVLIHGCNIYNTMNKGIAKIIKEKYPEAYKIDCKTIKGDRTKLGTYTFVPIYLENSHVVQAIYNLYTQATYWDINDMFSYEALENGIKKIYSLYSNFGNYKVPFEEYKFGIPAIGMGLANGNKEKIISILRKKWPENNLTMYILESEKENFKEFLNECNL